METDAAVGADSSSSSSRTKDNNNKLNDNVMERDAIPRGTRSHQNFCRLIRDAAAVLV